MIKELLVKNKVALQNIIDSLKSKLSKTSNVEEQIEIKEELVELEEDLAEIVEDIEEVLEADIENNIDIEELEKEAIADLEDSEDTIVDVEEEEDAELKEVDEPLTEEEEQAVDEQAENIVIDEIVDSEYVERNLRGKQFIKIFYMCTVLRKLCKAQGRGWTVLTVGQNGIIVLIKKKVK